MSDKWQLHFFLLFSTSYDYSKNPSGSVPLWFSAQVHLSSLQGSNSEAWFGGRVPLLVRVQDWGRTYWSRGLGCSIEDLLFPPSCGFHIERILNKRTPLSLSTTYDLAPLIFYTENWCSAGIPIHWTHSGIHFKNGWIHLGFPVEQLSLVFLFLFSCLFGKCNRRIMDRAWGSSREAQLTY